MTFVPHFNDVIAVICIFLLVESSIHQVGCESSRPTFVSVIKTDVMYMFWLLRIATLILIR